MTTYFDTSGKPVVESNIGHYQRALRVRSPELLQLRAQEEGISIREYEEVYNAIVYDSARAITLELTPTEYGELIGGSEFGVVATCTYGLHPNAELETRNGRKTEPRMFSEHRTLRSRLIHRNEQGVLHNGARCSYCERWMCNQHLTVADEEGRQLCVHCFGRANQYGVTITQMTQGKVPDFLITENWRAEVERLEQEGQLLQAQTLTAQYRHQIQEQEIQSGLLPFMAEVQRSGLIAQQAEHEARPQRIQLDLRTQEVATHHSEALLEREQIVNQHLPDQLGLQLKRGEAEVQRLDAETAARHQQVRASEAAIEQQKALLAIQSEATSRTLAWQEKLTDAEARKINRLTDVTVQQQQHAQTITDRKMSLAETVAERKLSHDEAALTHRMGLETNLLKIHGDHLTRYDDREDQRVDLKEQEINNQEREFLRQHERGHRQLDIQAEHYQNQFLLGNREIDVTQELGHAAIQSQERQNHEQVEAQKHGQNIAREVGLRCADVEERVGMAQVGAQRYQTDAERSVGLAQVRVDNRRVDVEAESVRGERIHRKNVLSWAKEKFYTTLLALGAVDQTALGGDEEELGMSPRPRRPGSGRSRNLSGRGSGPGMPEKYTSNMRPIGYHRSEYGNRPARHFGPVAESQLPSSPVKHRTPSYQLGSKPRNVGKWAGDGRELSFEPNLPGDAEPKPVVEDTDSEPSPSWGHLFERNEKPEVSPLELMANRGGLGKLPDGFATVDSSMWSGLGSRSGQPTSGLEALVNAQSDASAVSDVLAPTGSAPSWEWTERTQDAPTPSLETLVQEPFDASALSDAPSLGYSSSSWGLPERPQRSPSSGLEEMTSVGSYGSTSWSSPVETKPLEPTEIFPLERHMSYDIPGAPSISSRGQDPGTPGGLESIVADSLDTSTKD